MEACHRVFPGGPRPMNVNYAIVFTVALILGWLLCHAGVGT